MVAVGDGGDVAHLVVVNDGGGEKTTVVGCLMMPLDLGVHIHLLMFIIN